MAIITLIVCILTSLLLFLFPLPTATKLTGKYQHIGTLSFSLPLSSSNSTTTLVPVQCWFPLDDSSVWRNIMYYWQLKTLLWTSGNPDTQYRESDLLLTQISHNYRLPNLILHHLSLARTNGIYQHDFTHIIKSRKFPVCIYSHGMYGWRQIHHTACEQLASHGNIVFAVDHAPDCMLSRPVEDLNQSVAYGFHVPEGASLLQERAFYAQGFHRRSDDVVGLIDYILSSSFAAKYPKADESIDREHINVWGHSFGGGTISTVCCRDDRIRNAVALDGWLYPMPDSDRQSGLKSATLLNISAELWPYGKFQYPFRNDLVANSTSSSISRKVYNMVLSGSDHQNYCDTHLIGHRWLLQRPSVLGPNRDPIELLWHVEQVLVAFFGRTTDITSSLLAVVDEQCKGGDADIESGINSPTGEFTAVSSIDVNVDGDKSTQELIRVCTRHSPADGISQQLLPAVTQAYLRQHLVDVSALSKVEAEDYMDRTFWDMVILQQQQL